MSQQSIRSDNLIAQRVKANLQKAEGAVSDLRKTNARLLITGLVCSAGTTLVAGVPAAIGPFFGMDNAEWRLVCLIAALLGFVSAVSMGLNQQLNIGDRLSRGLQCVGELRSLDLMIATGHREREEIINEYEKIVQRYPGFI